VRNHAKACLLLGVLFAVCAPAVAEPLDSATAVKLKALLNKFDAEMARTEGGLHSYAYQSPALADEAIRLIKEIRTTSDTIRSQIDRSEDRTRIEGEVAKLMGLLDRIKRFARTAAGSLQP
jgi:hypothetical protein